MYLIARQYARTAPSRHLAVDGSWYQQSLFSPRRHSAGVPTGGSAALPRVELAHVALRLGCRLGLTYCQCRLQRQVAVGASNPYFRLIGFQAVNSVYRTDSQSVGTARHGLHGNGDSVTGRCGSTSATHTHTLSRCSCMGPVLRIPWTDGLDHHAPPLAVIGADPARQGHAHTYTGFVYHVVQKYQNVTRFFGAMQLTP